MDADSYSSGGVGGEDMVGSNVQGHGGLLPVMQFGAASATDVGSSSSGGVGVEGMVGRSVQGHGGLLPVMQDQGLAVDDYIVEGDLDSFFMEQHRLNMQFGRTAAKIAATKEWTDCVEILSPHTSPVARSAGPEVPLLHANDGCAPKEQGDAAFEENDGFSLKMQGDAAFEGNDYAVALALYTMAMEINPDDSTLYAKRSLSWMCMSEQDKALDDAYTYRTMKMDLSNSCCEQAAALILVKEYARACRALVSALKLDLRSDDLD